MITLYISFSTLKMNFFYLLNIDGAHVRQFLQICRHFLLIHWKTCRCERAQVFSKIHDQMKGDKQLLSQMIILLNFHVRFFSQSM